MRVFFVCTCACMGLGVVESGMVCVGQEGGGPLVEAMVDDGRWRGCSNSDLAKLLGD